jgi:16S rRNA (uracil1498-N3)-methyltransferase
VIQKTEKKKCAVVLDAVSFHKPRTASLHLCVAFTKNTSRNEWLLEKATELGVAVITPIIADRTDREKFRYDRWNSILISALLQSQQYYLPGLHEPTQLKQIAETYATLPQKIIGHCIEGFERAALSEMLKPSKETIVLIGPEGDFSKEEVNLCLEKGFEGVSMGSQRLRTETAAMAVCAYFNLINNENI